jgi:hypothetical protein
MSRHIKQIYDFVLESVLLDEAIRLSKTSIDDQVDSILLRFESDCILDDYNESVDERQLVEAPEDPKPELGAPAGMKADEKDDEEDEADDEKEADIEKSTQDKDDAKPDVESDPLKPKIDLHKFAGKVSRLASNYDVLLDMPIAIVNRARNYLEQNYNKAVANEFIDILQRDFDIDVYHDESKEEPAEKPIAVGAAASGLGG